MIHSKHVTLLVATIVALILVGVTYYLYLTTLMNSDDGVVSETSVEVNQEQTQTPQRTPEEIEALRQRLESVQ